MKRVELITVKDTFWIQGNAVNMLVLHPNFSVPKGGWVKCTEKVAVVKPDGHEIEATAQIEMGHVNIADPGVSIDERWRVTIWLTDRTKEDVPVGSKILTSERVRDALIL